MVLKIICTVFKHFEPIRQKITANKNSNLFRIKFKGVVKSEKMVT